MIRTRVLMLLAAALLAAGCSSGSGGDSAPADPYQVWLQRAPADAPSLSPDDALTRAMLGCGTDWPAGTTDAILQEVYDVC